jgi:hypothetical protein
LPEIKLTHATCCLDALDTIADTVLPAKVKVGSRGWPHPNRNKKNPLEAVLGAHKLDQTFLVRLGPLQIDFVGGRDFGVQKQPPRLLKWPVGVH